MSSLKQQIFSFIGVTGIYLGVLALSFPAQFTRLNVISIGAAAVVFLLSALISSTGSAENAEKNAQRFLIATTVQMLVALFFVLIVRFTQPGYFKGMAIHFLILFFVFLTLQAYFLVKRVRKTN
jgi:hypothetical protein